MAFSVLPPLIGEVSSSLFVALRIFDLLDRQPLINDSGGLILPSIDGPQLTPGCPAFFVVVCVRTGAAAAGFI